MGNKLNCGFCPFGNEIPLDMSESKFFGDEPNSVKSTRFNNFDNIKSKIISLQKFFRNLKSLKILKKKFLEKLVFKLNSNETKISQIFRSNFLYYINNDIKNILTDKIGITSLETINLFYIMDNFKNIPSDKIFNDLKIYKVHLEPIQLISKNFSEFYWGEWNLNYKKHGFGILVTSKEDFYLGTFKDNNIDGVGLLIINNKNIPTENPPKFNGKREDSNSSTNKVNTEKTNIYSNIISSNLKNYSEKTNFEDKNINDLKPNHENSLEINKNYQSKISDFSRKMINFMNNPSDKNNIDENSEINKLTCDIYIGEFKRGVAEGYGRLFSRNGEWYIGYFKNNKKDGEGEIHFSDGSFYIGNFKYNNIEGEGKYFFKDGSHYSGNFKDNMFNGKGKMAWADGRMYNGFWENNEMIGKSMHMWNNGNIYEGIYKNNVKAGKGIYYWDKIKFFEGDFVNNKINGNGFYNFEENTLKGDWKFGQLKFIKEIISKTKALRVDGFYNKQTNDFNNQHDDKKEKIEMNLRNNDINNSPILVNL